MKFKSFAFAFLAMFASMGAAHAAAVTWYLQDVAFDDGGTASGSFDFDADTAIFSNINVITTTGSVLPGETYDIVLPSSPGNSTFLSFANSTGIGDFTGTYAIGLELSAPMTNLGGLIAINLAGFALESYCGTADCFAVVQPLRLVTSGYITSEVPLPGAFFIFAVGLAGLRASRRKMGARIAIGSLTS